MPLVLDVIKSKLLKLVPLQTNEANLVKCEVQVDYMCHKASYISYF